MDDTTQSGSDSEPASGRFVLRIDPGLHGTLREAAKEVGLSLNEYCARRLTLPMSPLTADCADAVAQAAELVGEALLGVVAFGSWARQELAQESDIDLLIVVDEKLAIGRWLYAKWDERPLSHNGRTVEPHFVHPPQSYDRVSGTWAEVAMDGIVLFERGLAVSRLLVRLRRRVVTGELVRRRLHGQPYWVEVA